MKWPDWKQYCDYCCKTGYLPAAIDSEGASNFYPCIEKGECKMAKTVSVTLDVVAESEMAYLLSDGDMQEWVAKSLINNLSELHPEPELGTTHEFDIPEWIAKRQNWI